MRAVACLLLLCSASALWGQDNPFLLRAREHLQRGRYEEAHEAFAEAALDPDLTEVDRIQLAVDQCRRSLAVGEWDEAVQLAETAVADLPQVPRIWALLGEVHYELGQTDEAAKAINQALDLDSQEPRAMLIAGYLLADAGRYDEAAEQFRWFVRFYNRNQPKDADTLVTVGLGAAQYARWKSVPAVFQFIVNEVCVDAVKSDPDCWQALVLSGTLLAEKYNRAQAVPEFHSALTINPQCAEAHVGLGLIELTEMRLEEAQARAEQALAINPRLPAALRLQADIALFGDNLSAAQIPLKTALAVNPQDPHTLARLAVCHLLEEGLPTAEQLTTVFANLADSTQWGAVANSRFGEILQQVAKRNPQPGLFLHDVGQFLDLYRKFAQAEVCYRAAITCMPDLAAPKTALGMLCMRIGQVEEARTILDAAFQADQFHVRVSNMRKLLDVLQTYETIESPHFVVHCDPSEHVLGTEMSAYLESIYDELTRQFDFEPPTRTHFEIYSDAKDQNAHAWFSTRMSGLPWIQTVGASTGMIVALTSPAKTQEKYNWSRVLRHEFVHILTLQKTGFNIPHWYTEALAVTSEGEQLPDEWYDLLLTRVPAGEVFDLTTINQGFQRPLDADDWTMAYCQSKLYARYFSQRFGPEALANLLEAYRTQPETVQAVPQAFGLSLEELEQGYTEFLQQFTAEVSTGRVPGAPALAAAQAAVEATPESAAAHGELAYALIARRQIEAGFVAAEKAHQLDPQEPISATFLARRKLLDRKPDEALVLLQAARNTESPHPLLLDSLGDVAMRQKDYELAVQTLRIAVERYPLELDFRKKLLRAELAAGRPDTELVELLTLIAERDVDAVDVRKRLARAAEAKQDWTNVVHWGDEALLIDTLDADLQRLVAVAASQLRQDARALRAWQACDSLATLSDPDRLLYAKTLKRAKQKSAARAELLKITQDSPQFKEAQTELKLLEAP